MTSILKRFCWISCLVLNLLLSCAFAFQFNSLVTAGFETKRYRQKIQELSLKNEELSLGLIQNNKLDRIEEVAQKLNFEKSQDTEYIRNLSAEVVSRVQ